jgi:hypothetical protein
MRQETYRFALDQASAELRDIVAKFESLRSRKEQIEAVVEALRPFIGLQTQTSAIETNPVVEYAEPQYVETPQADLQYDEPAYIEPAYTEPAYVETVIEQTAPEPQFTFMQISGPGMEITTTESAPVTLEAKEIPESAHVLDEATAEQIAYFRQPSADPFQRRIDDALWGWQQRPEGLLSPI